MSLPPATAFTWKTCKAAATLISTATAFTRWASEPPGDRGHQGSDGNIVVCTRRYTDLPAINLAKKLAELAPGDLNKVLFAPGGAEAVGMALKLARAATGKYKTISMGTPFHGASLNAISVGGEAMFRSGIGPLLPALSTSARPTRPVAPGIVEKSAHCNVRATSSMFWRKKAMWPPSSLDCAQHAVRSPARILADHPRGLRPPWDLADLGQDPQRPRPHRQDVRLRALRHRS